MKIREYKDFCDLVMSFEDAEISEFNLYCKSDKAPFIIYADLESLSLCRIESGAKKPPPPTSFSPVTSTNVGISHQNF